MTTTHDPVREAAQALVNAWPTGYSRTTHEAFAALEVALASSPAVAAEAGETAAIELVIDALVKLNQRPRPLCRDCADNNGTCPNRDNLPCDMTKCIDDARATLAMIQAAPPAPSEAAAVAWWFDGPKGLGPEITTFASRRDELIAAGRISRPLSFCFATPSPSPAAAQVQEAPSLRKIFKIEPGSREHFWLLMAPYHLQMVAGKDAEHLLSFARDVWQAALSQPTPEADSTRAGGEGRS